MSNNGEQIKLSQAAVDNLVGFFDALILMDKELNLLRKEKENESIHAETSPASNTAAN